MHIQDLDAEIERLGKVILQACAHPPYVEVVIAARSRKSERANAACAVALEATEDVIGLRVVPHSQITADKRLVELRRPIVFVGRVNAPPRNQVAAGPIGGGKARHIPDESN